MRTVVFDLDGTLADTSGDLVAAANACFAGMGLGAPLDPGRDAGIAVKGGRAMLRAGLSRTRGTVDEAEVDAWYPRLLDHYGQAISVHTTLYPGAARALWDLRAAGFATAVCTNKPEALARQLLADLGVGDLFGALVGADTLPVRKPDPAPFRLAVARAGGDPARSMLVGDTDTDRATGRNAGVPVALVTFGPDGDAVAAMRPDALLDRFADLPALAARLLG